MEMWPYASTMEWWWRMWFAVIRVCRSFATCELKCHGELHGVGELLFGDLVCSSLELLLLWDLNTNPMPLRYVNSAPRSDIVQDY